MFYDDYLKKNRILSFSKTFLVVDLQESLVNLPNYVEKKKEYDFFKRNLYFQYFGKINHYFISSYYTVAYNVLYITSYIHSNCLNSWLTEPLHLF